MAGVAKLGFVSKILKAWLKEGSIGQHRTIWTQKNLWSVVSCSQNNTYKIKV